MSLTDTANAERAKEILFLAQVIADTSDNETERALAAMLTATAEEILSLHTAEKAIAPNSPR